MMLIYVLLCKLREWLQYLYCALVGGAHLKAAHCIYTLQSCEHNKDLAAATA